MASAYQPNQEPQGGTRKFGWRLGLSATPERTYDPEGNQFLDSEIGPTIFSFPLETAIERAVLSSFTYVPLPYDLTAEDRRRLETSIPSRLPACGLATPCHPKKCGWRSPRFTRRPR